jgi:tRNA-dihydrouridine synthase
MSNPWIFLQIAQLRQGEPIFQPAPADKYYLLLRYLELCCAAMPERIALNKLKQLMSNLFLGLPGSANLRSAVQRSSSIEAARELITTFFAAYTDTIPAQERASALVAW